MPVFSEIGMNKKESCRITAKGKAFKPEESKEFTENPESPTLAQSVENEVCRVNISNTNANKIINEYKKQIATAKNTYRESRNGYAKTLKDLINKITEENTKIINDHNERMGTLFQNEETLKNPEVLASHWEDYKKISKELVKQFDTREEGTVMTGTVGKRIKESISTYKRHMEQLLINYNKKKLSFIEFGSGIPIKVIKTSLISKRQEEVDGIITNFNPKKGEVTYVSAGKSNEIPLNRLCVSSTPSEPNECQQPASQVTQSSQLTPVSQTTQATAATQEAKTQAAQETSTKVQAAQETSTKVQASQEAKTQAAPQTGGKMNIKNKNEEGKDYITICE